MGNYNYGFVPYDFFNGGVHLFFVFRIHKSGRLIQDYYRCVFEDCPCQRNPLTFSTGKLLTAVTCHCVNSLRETVKKFVTLGAMSRIQNFFTGSCRSSYQNVFVKACVKEELLLGNI